MEIFALKIMCKYHTSDVTVHHEILVLYGFLLQVSCNFVELFLIFAKLKLCYKFLVRLHGEYNILV